MEKLEKPDIRGDKINILLLLFMYMLQGIVYGFTLSLPIYFQKRNVTYTEQAEFSFTDYPFCVKLFFAPLIDCIFIKKFGRRKTWVIPMQYLMGISLFFLSMNLDDWLGSEDGTRKPEIRLLTLTMIMCMFFSSIQDIALDGWSLTMLQRRNVEYVGSIQSIGGSIGQILSYILPIVLDSKDLCNLLRTVPQDRGFISIDNFMMLLSLVFMVLTTLVLIFKEDNSLKVIDDEDCECKLSPVESYKYIWKLATRRSMMILVLIVLTYSIGFGPQNGVIRLKMIDAGIASDTFVLSTILTLPIQTILSVLFRRRLFGPRSLHTFVELHVFLLIFGVVQGASLFFSYSIADENKSLPIWYISFMILMFNVRKVFTNLLKTCMTAYFFKISDPQFGGICTTFLFTILNIGTSWPMTFSLWCVDRLTLQICDVKVLSLTKNTCKEIDGFYTETVIFTVIGALWLSWSKKSIYKMENLDFSKGIVKRKKKTALIVEVDNLPAIYNTDKKKGSVN